MHRRPLLSVLVKGVRERLRVCMLVRVLMCELIRMHARVCACVFVPWRVRCHCACWLSKRTPACGACSCICPCVRVAFACAASQIRACVCGCGCVCMRMRTRMVLHLKMCVRVRVRVRVRVLGRKPNARAVAHERMRERARPRAHAIEHAAAHANAHAHAHAHAPRVCLRLWVCIYWHVFVCMCQCACRPSDSIQLAVHQDPVCCWRGVFKPMTVDNSDLTVTVASLLTVSLRQLPYHLWIAGNH
jgi:hypothetical protein